MAKGGARRGAGRPKKDAALHLVQGTESRAKYPTQSSVDPQWPEPPADLSAREREIWDGLRQHCGHYVVPSDWPSIWGTVSLTARLESVREAAASSPTQAAKLFRLELALWRELRAYLSILGLTPVDRGRVPMPPTRKPDSPLDRFLKPGGPRV